MSDAGTYALLVLAGALLCNGIPHLAAGLRGEAFPTPFADPPGRGLSSPLLNFLWGAANLSIGLWLLPRLDLVDPRYGRVAVAAGFVAIGCYLAVHFGRVRGER
ncbi:MAG: hypothetical protein JO290_06645 [Sphingomonadaceae bacterium]|nr:hypothetical protein [Sphingomonadaceae bacterium]